MITVSLIKLHQILLEQKEKMQNELFKQQLSEPLLNQKRDLTIFHCRI